VVVAMNSVKNLYNWKYVIPMASFTAWLWTFPLFGHLQGLFLYDNSLAFIWNLLFLSGLALGLFSHVFKFSERYYNFNIPTIIFITILLSFFSMRISPSSITSYNIGVYSSLFLGFFSSLYLVRWSSNLIKLEVGVIGTNMGLMMLLATIFYSLNLIFIESIISLYMSFGFLITAAFYSEKFLIKDTSKNEEIIDRSFKDSILKFWIPFALILAAFYIFSGILLNYIFPSVRISAPYFYILATLLYGITALLGGLYLDRFNKLENLVLIGIVFLGVFYFLSPVVESLPFINIGLEISYAFIDLFIWVGIAYASITFKYNSRRCFGFGLGLNITFILIGFIGNEFISGGLETLDLYSIALLVGIMMLVSIFPALSMRNITLNFDNRKLQLQTTLIIPENLTPREKQVFKLLMTKMNNEEIQDKLSISKNTLKTHIRNVYAKSGVKSRYELVVKYKGGKMEKK
jgi:DNA-binding CsgD family transcriptional regulator